ncbi:MAG: glycosyltransferase [Gemmatimonadota bacterium]|nr:glycosyltransferase [Gemmatimonadota bacterium]
MKIYVLVNDTPYGVMGLRARNIAAYLSSNCQVDILYREAGKFDEMRRFVHAIGECRPDLIYVMNVGYAGGGAALWARMRWGVPFLVDHGDPSFNLFKSSGRPLWESWLVRFAEWTMLCASEAVIARGAWLAETLKMRYPGHVFFIPDGVETDVFKPLDVSDLRQAHGLDGSLTIGVIGSIVWSDRYQMCYGWDVIETVRLLKDRDVKGVIVGDGNGLPHLKERAWTYGIEDRIFFAGRVPHEDVPRYINLMDICISTQTNDTVGRSRTTAKLPEYLACGRFIIATDVGGARDVVRNNGVLLPYQGVYDPDHPARLAEKVAWLSEHPEILKQGLEGVEIAKERFEYQQIVRQLQRVMDTLGFS